MYFGSIKNGKNWILSLLAVAPCYRDVVRESAPPQFEF